MRDPITGRFLRGHSGNPSGTVAGTPKVKQALMRLLNLPVSSRFVPRTYGEKVAFELYNLATKSRDDRAKLLAIREVFDRLYGRPPQEIAISEGQLDAEIEQELTRLGLLHSTPVIEVAAPHGYLAEPQVTESTAPLAESTASNEPVTIEEHQSDLNIQSAEPERGLLTSRATHRHIQENKLVS